MRIVETFIYKTNVSITSDTLINKFNLYHTGKESFPLDEDIPQTKSGEDLVALHNKLFSTTTIGIVLELLEDGSLRVKKDQSGT